MAALHKSASHPDRRHPLDQPMKDFRPEKCIRQSDKSYKVAV
jgi:hypothetical protein